MYTCMCTNIHTQVGISQNPFLQVRSSLLSLIVSLNSLSSLLLSSSSPLFALLFLILSPFPKWRCCGGRRGEEGVSVAASGTWLITHPGCWWTPEPHQCLLAESWSCEPSLSSFCLFACQSASQSVSLSVTEPAMQSSLFPCARCPYLPYSAPITTSPEGTVGPFFTQLLLSGSHVDPWPSPLVPLCMASHFTTGLTTDSHPGQSEKLASHAEEIRCSEEGMQPIKIHHS